MKVAAGKLVVFTAIVVLLLLPTKFQPELKLMVKPPELDPPLVEVVPELYTNRPAPIVDK